MTQGDGRAPLSVWHAIKLQTRVAAAVLGFSFAINVLGLTSSLYMLQIYDRVLSSFSFDTLVALTVIALVALAVMAGLEGLRTLMLQRLGARVSDRLGQQTFRAQLQGAAGLDAPSIQPLRDLDTIRNAIGSQASAIAFDLPWSPLYFILLYWLHPLLFWTTVAMAACLFALAYLNERINVQASAKSASESLKAMQFAESAARSGEAVLAMGAGASVGATWQTRARDAVLHALKALERESLLHALARLLRISLQVVLLGIGAALALSGELSGGAIIAASILGARAVSPIDGVIGSWRTVLAARQAALRLDKLYAALDWSPGMTLPKPKGHISADGIAVVLPGAARPLFSRVTFDLSPGEQMAIIGPTGSGKSTMARAIMGLVSCAAGKIRIDGAEVVQWGQRDLGGWIGYLPQTPQPIAGTIAQNIARFEDTHVDNIVAAAIDANAHQLILGLPQGYDTQIGPGGVRLSGGQIQRIALATALYSRPPIVVLDEPEAHLDHEGESSLRDVLQKLRDRQATVIVVSHRPSAVRFVDRALILRGGTGEFGLRDDVLSRFTGAKENPAPQPNGPPTGGNTL